MPLRGRGSLATEGRSGERFLYYVLQSIGRLFPPVHPTWGPFSQDWARLVRMLSGSKKGENTTGVDTQLTPCPEGVPAQKNCARRGESPPPVIALSQSSREVHKHQQQQRKGAAVFVFPPRHSRDLPPSLRLTHRL